MKVPVAIVVLLLTIAPIAAKAQTDEVTGTGKEIFDQMCAGCHGTYGNGQEGTKAGFVPRIGTLANKKYMDSVPDDYLKMIINKGGEYMGKIAAMPAWEHKFNGEQIADLVAHIRTFTGTAETK
ncbi:MAG: cytochrome c [Betaproteobacteria bacterium]